MNNVGLACQRVFTRYSEALFIIAFVAADCFLSGWMLTCGTYLAILWVCAPVIAELIKTPANEVSTLLKAFVKTRKVQRLGFLLFWLWGMRTILEAACGANLFRMDYGRPLSLTNALIGGVGAFAPLWFLSSPILIYAAACLVSIFTRSRLKATSKDPDLIAQRQTWSGLTHFVFLSSFVASILSITLNKLGPAYMLSNWLLASAKDANFFGFANGHEVSAIPSPFPPADFGVGASQPPMLEAVDPSGIFNDMTFVNHFDVFVVGAMSVLALLLLLQPVLKLNALLTSFCWRVVSPKSLQNIVESFLEALRLPTRALNFRESHPVWNNALRTLGWLVFCFAALFWLFGFCGGPLGYAIEGWMMASVVEAGILPATDGPNWLFQPNLRIFLGAVVALYATAPVAVTAAVFLPCAKPRQFTLNADGILFAHGPYLALWGRQFRLWSDLKNMTVKRLKPKPNRPLRAKFCLSFRSGGQIVFDSSQVSAQDLRVLLDAIDQHAVACNVDPEVFEICQELVDADSEKSASDGKLHTAVAAIPVQEFKATIFVPVAPGEFLPGSKTRVIKQLASKPLCAVYLARDEQGRMVIVKHFYLADDSQETKALAKILKREYELLSHLDHPGIAKVLDSFSVDESTFLVIEHRVGNDLRATVNEHGPRPERLMVAWAKQLCEIMIYLHGRDPAVLHRDLTPDNVIAGEDGQLRLIDFGAAREFLDGITGTMIGKHCYIPPEQLRGEATTRSDIYSFGGTLYFLLTGRDPRALSQSSPAKDMDCSEEIDRLIRDCTAFDQDDRPQSFEQILQRLNEIDGGKRIKLPKPKRKQAVNA
ncbi:MAG: serine/threonine-protein kinase [Candidatus Obscuribacterales bacterium]